MINTAEKTCPVVSFQDDPLVVDHMFPQGTCLKVYYGACISASCGGTIDNTNTKYGDSTLNNRLRKMEYIYKMGSPKSLLFGARKNNGKLKQTQNGLYLFGVAKAESGF